MNSQTPLPVSRLHGLSADEARSAVAVAHALNLGHLEEADRQIIGLVDLHPNHPEVLRLLAGVQSLRGDFHSAIGTLKLAIALRPSDALYLNTLGSALIEGNRYDEAIATLRRACELDPKLASAWFNLGLVLMRSMQVDESAAALHRALALSPDLAIGARAILGDMFRAEGRTDEAAAEYRAAIAQQPHAGMSWWGLADMKTQRFVDEDVTRLRHAMKHPSATDDDRVAMGFALAKAFDERGLYAESLAALAQAHAIVRARKRWDAPAYNARVASILSAFTPPPVGAADPQGHEVIFIVSMPRSGSTLVEQVLASHSLVAGAGELADLPLVLTEEAQRQGKPFPQYISSLEPHDWERLGRRYLERTARWRKAHPRFTDKMPSNWLYVGAALAMLPGARIIIGRRDPLETCLSCYRQHFSNNEYTRTFTDLAATWRDFDRAAKHWREWYPTRVHENVHEELIADPETNIRGLLAFCDLSFEPACLNFHLTQRHVHTPSAMQVREPLRRDTARARRYGSLLDPLRTALGIAPFSANPS